MNPEVLAPIGNWDSLVAAVYSGADAVYFGADKFNARRNADNFSVDNLKAAIAFCKQNGVKSYLALNIIIKDCELAEAVELAYNTYRFGIDGIIIQDIGLAVTLHRLYPDLPLHASTQLSVHSPAALKLLKQLGFSRVVPAREMSKNNLAALCTEARKLKMEVEVFVHGALCMCVSGQCYFSAHLGARSANRGLCAGTCRLPFSGENRNSYTLSLKDLSLVNHINELKEMGVTSFKIEGRMKRPEYVAAAVNCISGALTDSTNDSDLALLEQVFSRSGFTDGYYKENMGIDMFGIRTEQDHISSKEVLNKLHSLYRRPKQKLPIDFHIKIKTGVPVVLMAQSGSFKAVQNGPVPEKAINRDINQTAVENHLSKLGGTPYFLSRITCDIDTGLMLTASALNAVKKSVLKELDSLRCKLREVPKTNFIFTPVKSNKKIKGLFLRFANEQQVLCPDNIVTGYSLPAEELILRSTLKGLPKAQNPMLSPAAELPRGADDDEYTISALEKLKAMGVKTVVCGNLSAVALAKKAGLNVFGGFGLNLFNSVAVDTAKALGVTSGVVSAELSIPELQSLTPKSFETYAFCYGRFPLMLTRNCPVGAKKRCSGKSSPCIITDRLGEKFPVVCRNSYSEILNSRPTDIADCILELSADFGYLYFTLETKGDIERILDGFKKGKITSSPFTRGLSKSGVL